MSDALKVNISKSDAKVNVQFWLDRGKSILSSDELEMYELALLGGIVIDPEVFKNILELLQLNVVPSALERMLRSMLLARFPQSQS